ncbi:hypothetical protein DXG01_009849 [Tephrocybe rancida]|nr:hypothetical protein DXG01_009849 [Tephrocybe rancida]
MFKLITAAPLWLTVLQGRRQHRANHGLSRRDPKSVVFAGKDAEELFNQEDEDMDDFMFPVENLSPTLAGLMDPYIQELKTTVEFAKATRVARSILFHPLMLGSNHTHFKRGILIEVVRKSKQIDGLAVGGRYDHLIDSQAPLKSQSQEPCAMELQIAVEKITIAVASYQSSSIKALINEEHFFVYWSLRRCDVYVVSYHPGYLQDRFGVVSYLWEYSIGADLMYEPGLPDTDHENYINMCAKEGILFIVSLFSSPLHSKSGIHRRDQ